MTEEVKCDCKEKAMKKLKEFFFIAGAVFVGATLAILLSFSIMRPKCPHHPMGMPHRPGMERQLPPPPAFDRGEFRGEFNGQGRNHKQKCNCPCHKKHGNGEFKGSQFPAPQMPDKFQQPEANK